MLKTERAMFPGPAVNTCEDFDVMGVGVDNCAVCSAGRAGVGVDCVEKSRLG